MHVEIADSVRVKRWISVVTRKAGSATYNYNTVMPPWIITYTFPAVRQFGQLAKMICAVAERALWIYIYTLIFHLLYIYKIKRGVPLNKVTSWKASLDSLPDSVLCFRFSDCEEFVIVILWAALLQELRPDLGSDVSKGSTGHSVPVCCWRKWKSWLPPTVLWLGLYNIIYYKIAAIRGSWAMKGMWAWSWCEIEKVYI